MPQSCLIYVYIGVALTIHQAIGVYMHWVILGMELEYQALGTRQQTPNLLLTYDLTYVTIR